MINRKSKLEGNALTDKIIALYREGKSLREIGRHTGISHECVRKMIPDKYRRGNQYPDEFREKVYKAYCEHHNFQIVADMMGISARSTVAYIVKSFGG